MITGRSRLASSAVLLVPFLLAPPLPGGDFDLEDKQHAAFVYSGVAAASESAPPETAFSTVVYAKVAEGTQDDELIFEDLFVQGGQQILVLLSVYDFPTTQVSTCTFSLGGSFTEIDRTGSVYALLIANPVPGLGNVVVTTTTVRYLHGCAMVVSDANFDDAAWGVPTAGGAGFGFNPTVTVPTTVGHLVIDFMTHEGAPSSPSTPGSGQTLLGTPLAGVGGNPPEPAGCSFKVATSTSTVMSWTTDSEFFWLNHALTGIVGESPGGGETPPGTNPPDGLAGDVLFAHITIHGTHYPIAETTLRDPSGVYGGKKRATLDKVTISERVLARDGYRPSTCDLEFSDTPDPVTGEMLWRGLAATANLEGAYVAVYRCHAPYSMIVGTPFRVWAGEVKEGGYTALTGFKYRLSCIDLVGARLADPRYQPQIPPTPLTRAIFPVLDPSFEGKAAPVALGRLVEDGRGVVPTVYLGGPANLQTSLGGAALNVDVDVHLIAERAVYNILKGYYNPMVWGAEIDVLAGDLIRPTLENENGHVFRATVAGTTATTEPTWPLSGTVADGTVTWEEVGADDPYARYELPPQAYSELLTHPFAPNWTFATGLTTQYVDYAGRRWVPVFVLHSHRYARAIREGRVSLTFDVLGVTENADGSGAVIDSFEYLYIHILLNDVFFQTDGITMGTMPMLPGPEGDYSLVDTVSADASVALGADVSITQAGFLLGAHGNQQTWFELASRLLEGGGFRVGHNRHGQVVFGRKDPQAAAVIQFTTRDFISSRYYPDTSVRGTRFKWRYGYRYTPPVAPPTQPGEPAGTFRAYGEWESGMLVSVHEAAEAARDGRFKYLDIDNYVTRDPITAEAVMEQLRDDATGIAPAYSGTWRFELVGPWARLLLRLDSNGKTRELGQMIGITDPEGLSATGYTQVRGWIDTIRLDPQTDLVTLGGEIVPGEAS